MHRFGSRVAMELVRGGYTFVMHVLSFEGERRRHCEGAVLARERFGEDELGALKLVLVGHELC